MADKVHANFALRSGSCSVNLKTPFVLTECHVGGKREREEEREKGKRFPYGNYSLYFSFLPFLPKILDVAQFQAIVSREMFRLSLFLSDEKVWLLNFQRHYLCRESQVAFMNYSCESWSKIVKTDIFFFEKNLPSPRSRDHVSFVRSLV